MSAISGDWLEALKGEFHQPYYAKLYKTVMTEYQTRKIFPPADDLFNAFHFTPLNEDVYKRQYIYKEKTRILSNFVL